MSWHIDINTFEFSILLQVLKAPKRLPKLEWLASYLTAGCFQPSKLKQYPFLLFSGS